MDRNGTGMEENGHFGAKGIIKTLFQWTRKAISIKLYRYCPNLQNYILLSSFLAIFTFIQVTFKSCGPNLHKYTLLSSVPAIFTLI